MTPFLRQAAAYYCRQTDLPLGACCFVFPNRRAAAFFRKHLQDEVRLQGPGRAQFAPKLLTVNDFFYQAAGVHPTDRIQLLIELYDCYKSLRPNAEPLDEFIFWGDILLGDFDDIDKYRVDAKSIFANVSDIKAIQDDYSYLSDTQRIAIEHFLTHFRDNAGVLTVDLNSANPRVKERFLGIWNLLYPLYTSFRETLRGKGMAYEGMVYRDLADRLAGGESAVDILEDGRKYVFVGLNALNECEKTVLGKLRDAGLAEFVWDYVSGMIRDRDNKSSVFMEDNVHRFPQAFPLSDDPNRVPDITVISVPSATGQAKLLPQILDETDRRDPLGTAVVLPDENLLIPVLNSIPPQWEDINVTMGYPLPAGAVHTLMDNAAALQMNIRQKDGQWFFYHRPATALFSNSLFRRLLSAEEKEAVRKVLGDARYYIPQEQLAVGDLMKLIFQPVVTEPKERKPEQIRRIVAWQKEILTVIGRSLTHDDSMLLELDLTKRYLTAVEMLAGRKELTNVQPAAWFRLMDRMLAAQSVPFNGEPLKGLQIMGPLETRALDFRHLILLSANEGVFPRHSVSSSFIPPELRKGFGLPTYEFQDAVWAYYFYRLLQRAEKVWLVYDSRTEGIRSGEESRYVKQLQYHFRVPIRRETVLPELKAAPALEPVAKTEETMKKLHERPLSASRLNDYFDCPVKFYYSFICRLKDDDDVTESLDSSALGTVFHAVMQTLYTGIDILTPDVLKGLIKDESRIRGMIHELIKKEMNSFEVKGRNLLVADVIFQYVIQTLKSDLELARDHGGIRILGLERDMDWQFAGFSFTGKIDRLDSLGNGGLRIIDYKSGSLTKNEQTIPEKSAEATAAKLFGDKHQGRPTKAFQLFVYDRMVRSHPDFAGAVPECGFYSPALLFLEPPKTAVLPDAFCERVEEGLRDKLAELDDPTVPFRHATDPDACKYCDFKIICGR